MAFINLLLATSTAQMEMESIGTKKDDPTPAWHLTVSALRVRCGCGTERLGPFECIAKCNDHIDSKHRAAGCRCNNHFHRLTQKAALLNAKTGRTTIRVFGRVLSDTVPGRHRGRRAYLVDQFEFSRL